MTVTNAAFSLGLVLTLGSGMAELQAAQVTYVFAGIGSGALGSTEFFLAPFTITSQSDTNQITLPTPDIYHAPATSAIVTITGLNPATFTIPTIIVANDILGSAGISAPNQNRGILFSRGDTALLSYHLDTSIGPLSGTADYNPGTPFATSGGNFVIDSINTATFQATVVPEPSTASLLVIGCVAALVARRR